MYVAFGGFSGNDASQAFADTTEISLEELLELQRRNEERENEECICVPLEDVLRGPGHVAWKLIKDIKDNPDSDFEFNEEQILVIALLIWPLEQAWREQLKGGQSPSATVDTLRKLPNN